MSSGLRNRYCALSVVFIVLLFFSTIKHTPANAGSFIRVSDGASKWSLSLKGSLKPGGVLVGSFIDNEKSLDASEISLIHHSGQVLPIDGKGQFLIAFDRDAPLQQRLKLSNGQGGLLAEYQLNLSVRDYELQKIEGVEQKYVSPPSEVLSRIRQDGSDVYQSRRHYRPSVRVIDRFTPTQSFRWPAEGRISGIYGSQRVFNGVPKRPHYGVDLAAPTGTPIYAPADGVITLAQDLYYSGNTIVLDHGMGLSSSFLHLDSFDVQLGDKVRKGQLIGKIGATGRVTGPHLDWRMNWTLTGKDIRLDPEEALAIIGRDDLPVLEICETCSIKKVVDE